MTKTKEQLAEEYLMKSDPNVILSGQERRLLKKDFIAGHESRDEEVKALKDEIQKLSNCGCEAAKEFFKNMDKL